jgi:hypothetical protein
VNATVALITECRDALAEELSAWDIDPPLHHVKQAHDKCVAWLAAPQPALTDEQIDKACQSVPAAIYALMHDDVTVEQFRNALRMVARAVLAAGGAK